MNTLEDPRANISAGPVLFAVLILKLAAYFVQRTPLPKGLEATAPLWSCEPQIHLSSCNFTRYFKPFAHNNIIVSTALCEYIM